MTSVELTNGDSSEERPIQELLATESFAGKIATGQLVRVGTIPDIFALAKWTEAEGEGGGVEVPGIYKAAGFLEQMSRDLGVPVSLAPTEPAFSREPLLVDGEVVDTEAPLLAVYVPQDKVSDFEALTARSDDGASDEQVMADFAREDPAFAAFLGNL